MVVGAPMTPRQKKRKRCQQRAKARHNRAHHLRRWAYIGDHVRVRRCIDLIIKRDSVVTLFDELDFIYQIEQGHPAGGYAFIHANFLRDIVRDLDTETLKLCIERLTTPWSERVPA